MRTFAGMATAGCMLLAASAVQAEWGDKAGPVVVYAALGESAEPDRVFPQVMIAQAGDPDRLFQQAALGHAATVESAWWSVASRIGVIAAGSPPGLWNTEWNGTSDPTASGWWLSEWTERGLSARYCDGVLAVYADRDELKGVGRDQVSVQIAPTVYGDGEKRSGLHRIEANSRQYKGAWGREDGTLPGCMPIVSASGDRVALVGAVPDPRLTAVRIRWENEPDRVVACPVATDTGDITERRRIPIQVTAVTGCSGTNCTDLAQQAGIPPAWLAACDDRQVAIDGGTLEPEARCTDWVVWRNTCKATFQTSAVTTTPGTTTIAPTVTGNPVTQTPVTLPTPTIVLRPAPDQNRTEDCGCGANEEGSCTNYFARSTVWRDFYLRPGATAVTTRIINPNNPGWRLVDTIDTCTPIQTDDPGGPDDPGPGDPGGDQGGVGGPGGGGGSDVGDSGGVGGHGGGNGGSPP